MTHPLLRAFLITWTLLSVGCEVSKKADVAPVDPIVASWDGREIRLSQLEERYRIKQVGEFNLEDSEMQMESVVSILRKWVMDEILLKEASALGISITEEQITEYLKNRVGEPAEQGVAFIDADVFREDYRKEVQKQLMLQAVGTYLMETEPQESETFDTWLAEHSPSENAEEKENRRCVSQLVVRDEKDAKDLLAKLTDKKPIEDLAKEYSITPEASRGGFMGCFKEGELPEYLEEVVFHLTPGHPSDIIQSSYGYHILMIMKEEASEEIDQKQNQKMRELWKFEETEKKIQQWLEAALKKNHVQFNNDWIKKVQPS